MKPLTIGITGGSGAGKTSFIRDLSAAFSSEEVGIISQDDYYLPKDQQIQDEEGWFNYDLPSAIDIGAFVKDIQSLLSGNIVQRGEYVFNNRPKDKNVIIVKPAPVIIIEGLFISHFDEVKALLDLRLFINAKENLKVIRRIKRDQEERNYDLKEVLYRYEHHVSPTFEKYIKPYMEEADLIINNNEQFHKALDVISGYLKNFIREYKQEITD